MRSWLAGMMMIVGCLPKGEYSLAPHGASTNSGEFHAAADVKFNYQPGKGSALHIVLRLAYEGDQRTRVDLTNLYIKVDGLRWSRCRHGPETDKDSLFWVMGSGDKGEKTIVCKDVARPYKSVEIKFHTAGLATRGVVVLEYEGIPAPL